jgi:endoglucanase
MSALRQPARLFFCLLLAACAGLSAQSSGYWHTAGSRILDDSNQPVRIAGLNWFGFETQEAVLHGLEGRDYRALLHTAHGMGFNTLRIPFSNQMVEHPSVPFPDRKKMGVNQELAGLNSLEILDRVLQAAGAEGLKVILDNHRSDPGNSNQPSGLWYTPNYPESAWIADWQMLVTRYRSLTDEAGNVIVIGVDLRNEPYSMVAGQPTGSCWTGDTNTGGCPETDLAHNWPAAAQRAAQAIQAINPNLLIFVEGVDCYSGSCDWQGGNLQGAAAHPVQLPVANRLVYEAHDYGPEVSPQPWFTPQTTPSALEAVWTRNWAYLAEQNLAPVWLGEFGTPNEAASLADSTPGSQGQWFSSLVAFLHTHGRVSWAYWALNGEDRAGLLNEHYDATPANPQKLAALESIQLPGPDEPDPPAQPDPRSRRSQLHIVAVVGVILLSLAVVFLLRPRRKSQARPTK